MLLGIFIYFGLYLAQLAFIWKIDGIHKYEEKKLLSINSKLLKHIVLHYSRCFNVHKERKLLPKNDLYSNTIEVNSLLLQIVAHVLYLAFIVFRIRVVQTNGLVFSILQIIVFCLAIVYTICLMVYQGVHEDKIIKEFYSKSKQTIQ